MWLWKGVQSATFYYVSLSPCYQYNYSRKRRRDAKTAGKERAELEMSQPGVLYQPVSFQTNQYWAEEIEAGPGPPRGRRKHKPEGRPPSENSGAIGDAHRRAGAATVTVADVDPSLIQAKQPDQSSSSTIVSPPTEPEIHVRRPPDQGPAMQSESPLHALRDTIKSTIPRPDMWNWERYDREDETLFGINDRISRLWERATHHSQEPSTDAEGNQAQHLPSSGQGRKSRASTLDSEDYSWRYATNPAVNDLHPPTVNQFPRTKREVAWIKQPPPSRAVMEGKIKPETENSQRRPLCRLGGVPVAQTVETAACRGRRDGDHRGDISPTNLGQASGKTVDRGIERQIEGAEVIEGREQRERNEDGDGNHDEGDKDEDFSREVLRRRTLTQPTPDDDHFPTSLHPSHSLNLHHQNQRQQKQHNTQPPSSSTLPALSPPKRPPLAVLVDSNSHTTKIHSYQVTPISASPKALVSNSTAAVTTPTFPSSNATDATNATASTTTSPYGFELDILMDIIFQESSSASPLSVSATAALAGGGGGGGVGPGGRTRYYSLPDIRCL